MIEESIKKQAQDALKKALEKKELLLPQGAKLKAGKVKDTLSKKQHTAGMRGGNASLRNGDILLFPSKGDLEASLVPYTPSGGTEEQYLLVATVFRNNKVIPVTLSASVFDRVIYMVTNPVTDQLDAKGNPIPTPVEEMVSEILQEPNEIRDNFRNCVGSVWDAWETLATSETEITPYLVEESKPSGEGDEWRGYPVLGPKTGVQYDRTNRVWKGAVTVGQDGAKKTVTMTCPPSAPIGELMELRHQRHFNFSISI